jgi:YbbR domain-containing protein
LRKWLASLGRHKGLKLLALLLAVALWFAVGGEERTETTISIPLELANLPLRTMVTSEMPPSLQVRIVGPGSLVRKLTQTRPAYTLDLSGFKPGRFVFPLGPKSFNLPRGVVVTRVTPNPLTLTLASTATRTLPIQPVLEGKPPEGFAVLAVKTRPAQVQVEGPYNEISNLKFLPTLPIDVSQVTRSTTVTTDLDLKNLHLTIKEQGPILADLTIESKQVTRTISGVPVKAVPRAARLKPSQVTVTLQGPAPAVKNLKPGEVMAVVETRNLPPGRHRLMVSVRLPDELGLVKVQPEAVTAWVGKSP